MDAILKEFTEKNIHLIEENRFKELYIIAEVEPDVEVYDLTKLLYDADIDPLQYLDYIPSGFMSGTFDKQPEVVDLSYLPRIKHIEGDAFAYNLDLKEIILPPNLETIGSIAFLASGLKKIIIPKSVAVIGDAAFLDCKYLSEVIIEGKPIIRSNAFSGDHVMRKFIIHDKMLKYNLPPANINTHIEIV